MRTADVEEIITACNKEITGLSKEEIEELFIETVLNTDGSLIDGVKLGYLYAVVTLEGP